MKYPKYPAYKDSGVEWIGDIPILWKLTKFRRIANTVKGKLDSAPLYERITENCIPYLSMEYLRSEIDPIQWVHKENSSVIANKGDILLLWDGSNAGEFLRAKFGAVSSTIALVKPKKVNEGYFFYLCKFIEIQIQELTVGMGIPHVDADVLKDFITLLPSIDEQDKLYNFLESRISRINFLITNLQKMIELLKEKRQAIITHAVTKGLDLNVPMRDSGVEWIGEIPEHWILATIRRGYEIILGKMLQSEPKNSNDEFLPYLRASNIQYNGVDFEDIKKMYFSPIEKKHLLLKKNDLLVSEGGDAGRSIVLGKEPEGFLGYQNSINRIRATRGNNVRFLYFWLSLLKESGYIDAICNRATFTHYTVEKVKATPALYPPIGEQIVISKYVLSVSTRINSLISNLQKMIELLKEYRSSLINQAVTGKIDVRNLKINEI
jgi:type I restriction enzyme S subunit